MPSGSGIDCGTKFDWGSKPNKLVFTFSYHHMDEAGLYSGWMEHTLIVKPSLQSGFDMRITGPNRNQIKEYLFDIYEYALKQQVWQTSDCVWYSDMYETQERFCQGLGI
jgi:hypothetical protein